MDPPSLLLEYDSFWGVKPVGEEIEQRKLRGIQFHHGGTMAGAVYLLPGVIWPGAWKYGQAGIVLPDQEHQYRAVVPTTGTRQRSRLGQVNNHHEPSPGTAGFFHIQMAGHASSEKMGYQWVRWKWDCHLVTSHNGPDSLRPEA